MTAAALDTFASQPRARGDLSLHVGPRGGATHIRDFFQSGSLKALFPRTPHTALTAVMLNTAGGLTGGDRFDLRCTAEKGANLVLTTQAAERVYRAQPGEVARVNTTLQANDATLHWLPQEMILYDGAALDRRLRIDCNGAARVLMVEPVVFGRTAMRERVEDLQFSDRVDIYRDGALAFADRTRLDGNADDTLSRKAVAAGAGAMASVVLSAPDAHLSLDPARALLPDTGGASLLAENLLFIRLLACDSFTLRKYLLPLITCLGVDPLPRTWML